MRIELTELREGSNHFVWEIPPEQASEFGSAADDAYFSRPVPTKVALDVQRFDRTLRVVGRVDVPLAFRCALGDEECDLPLSIRVHWTLLPRDQFEPDGGDGEDGKQLAVDDLDVSFYDGEEIDLDELVREAVVLELDPAPRCGLDTCPGAEYLRRLSAEAEARQRAEAEKPDPRWAGLEKFKSRVKKS